MRKSIFALLVCAAPLAHAAGSVRAIVNATLIDGRGGAPVKNAKVIVLNRAIACAGTGCSVPQGAEVFDAKGMWVAPGLVDAHVHFSQTGWADGRPDALDVRAQYPYEKTIGELKSNPERFAHSYLCAGVTSVFDVGGYPWTLQLASRFEGRPDTPHISAAGPLLSTLDHWLNLPAERQFIFLKDEATGRDGVKYLASQGARAVKVWYIEENEKAIMAAGDEAAKAGLPLIVHATELDRAKAALRAGAKLLVHSVWDKPVDDEFIELMKKNGAILSPTLIVGGGYVRMYESVVSKQPPAIDDPNHCVDAKTIAKVNATPSMSDPELKPEQVPAMQKRIGDRRRIADANLKRLVDAGIPIATGTDAGNPLTLHGVSMYAEMEAMQAAGMTPMQVIVASTATAARAARLDDVTGTIEQGKAADLVILAGDPSTDVANFRRLKYVMRDGALRGIEELSATARR